MCQVLKKKGFDGPSTAPLTAGTRGATFNIYFHNNIAINTYLNPHLLQYFCSNISKCHLQAVCLFQPRFLGSSLQLRSGNILLPASN